MTALFADDTLLFHPACHGFKNSLCCPVQADLDALSSWAADLNVSFNPLKSVDVRFGPRPSQEVLQVDGVAIPQRKEARHLGACLSAGPSLTIFAQKLGYQHCLSSSFIRRLFKAFVRPKLEYCNAVWCGLPRWQAIRLEKLQVKVA